MFRVGKNQGNADGLSRLPLVELAIEPKDVPTPGDTILISGMSSVVTATSIRHWIHKDPMIRMNGDNRCLQLSLTNAEKVN